LTLTKPLPPTPSPQRRGGASRTASLLLPLSVAGRGLGGEGFSHRQSAAGCPETTEARFLRESGLLAPHWGHESTHPQPAGWAVSQKVNPSLGWDRMEPFRSFGGGGASFRWATRNRMCRNQTERRAPPTNSFLGSTCAPPWLYVLGSFGGSGLEATYQVSQGHPRKGFAGEVWRKTPEPSENVSPRSNPSRTHDPVEPLVGSLRAGALSRSPFGLRFVSAAAAATWLTKLSTCLGRSSQPLVTIPQRHQGSRTFSRIFHQRPRGPSRSG